MVTTNPVSNFISMVANSSSTVWSDGWNVSEIRTIIGNPTAAGQLEQGGGLSETGKIILGVVLGTGLFLVLVVIVTAALCSKFHKSASERKSAYQVNGTGGIEMSGSDRAGIAHYQDSKA